MLNGNNTKKETAPGQRNQAMRQNIFNKKFGEEQYSDTAYFTFENNESLMKIVDQDYDITRIISEISIIWKVNISSENIIIIFSEIQVNFKEFLLA